MLGLLLVMGVPVRSTQVNDTHQQQCMGCILASGTIHVSSKQAGISLLLQRETRTDGAGILNAYVTCYVESNISYVCVRVSVATH